MGGIVPAEVVGDPFYSEVVGAALVLADVSDEVVSQIVGLNPLALACALRFFRARDTPLENRIVAEILKWCRREERSTFRSGAREWLEYVLAETDSPHVLRISASLRTPTWWLSYARFLNGDALAGVLLHSRNGPGVRSPQIQNAAKHSALRGGGKFRAALSLALTSTDTSERNLFGSLNLIGFLEDPSYCQIVSSSWQMRSNMVAPEVVGSYLWALARCGTETDMTLLDPILKHWAHLSDEKPMNENRSSERSRVIKFGIRQT